MNIKSHTAFMSFHITFTSLLYCLYVILRYHFCFKRAKASGRNAPERQKTYSNISLLHHQR